MTGEPTHTASKKETAPCVAATNYCLKSEVSIMLRYQLCSTRYTALRKKNFSKNTYAVKVPTMKNADDFYYEGKPSRATAKSALFAVSKDEWDTKEDTGKSMKNVLYVLRYAKRFLSGRSYIEQRKNQARSLSRYQVRLSEGISQLLNQ